MRWTVIVLLIVGACEGRRGGGGGGRGGGRGGSFGGGGSRGSFGARGGRSRSGWGGRSYSKYSYYPGGGMSRSSSGFGQGLGTGLAIGYVAGSLNSHAYYGHRHGQHAGYSRRGGYDQTRPISCYTADLKSGVTGELDLNETLTQCDVSHDVCYGKMTLSVTNVTSGGSIVTTAAIAVDKGCGYWADFNNTGSFSSLRQCFVSDIKNTTAAGSDVTNVAANANSKVTDIDNKTNVNKTTDMTEEGSGDMMEATSVTQEQTEVCLCMGTRCNGAGVMEEKAIVIVLLLVAVGLADFWK